MIFGDMDFTPEYHAKFKMVNLANCLNMNRLAKQSDEERFMYVLKSLKKTKAFKLWMTKKRDHDYSKSIEKSQQFREHANELYTSSGQFVLTRSILMFTKSIVHAPFGSQQLALAYANRSAACLTAGLYKECLLDIKRSLKAGYPPQLKAKLFVRRALCLKALGHKDVDQAVANARGWLKRMPKSDPSRQKVEHTLDNFASESLPPPRSAKWNGRQFHQEISNENARIAGASASVAIEYSQKGEKYVVATADIKPGEIIAIQQPYVSILHEFRQWSNCDHCHEQTWSAIPCNYCIHVVYCSEVCRDAALSEYHHVECTVLDRMMALTLDPSNRLALRALIKCVKKEGSFQALRNRIREIEKAADEREFDTDEFASFYNLPRFFSNNTADNLLEITYTSIYVVFLLATRSKFFGEEMELQKFFQHPWVPLVGGLMTRYSMIALTNPTLSYEWFCADKVLQSTIAVAPFYSLCSHSCSANVWHNSFGKKLVVYAYYPIKKGEKIYRCRGDTFDVVDKTKRQQKIIRQTCAPCDCIACVEDWSVEKSLWHTDTEIPEQLVEYLDVWHMAIPKQLALAETGNPITIAVTIYNLTCIICHLWPVVRPQCPELIELSKAIIHIFRIMGNHYDVI